MAYMAKLVNMQLHFTAIYTATQTMQSFVLTLLTLNMFNLS